jgi:hypothetical protein
MIDIPSIETTEEEIVTGVTPRVGNSLVSESLEEAGLCSPEWDQMGNSVNGIVTTLSKAQERVSGITFNYLEEMLMTSEYANEKERLSLLYPRHYGTEDSMFFEIDEERDIALGQWEKDPYGEEAHGYVWHLTVPYWQRETAINTLEKLFKATNRSGYHIEYVEKNLPYFMRTGIYLRKGKELHMIALQSHLSYDS